MDEKISIIVIAYNVDKYIQKCIDSIINQTYTNLQIIIIDDASKDKTGEICKEYQNKDYRIEYIRHKINLGHAMARNTGLDNAIGEYITFIDPDDYVTNDYCEVLYKNLLQTQSDISICNFKKFNEDQQVNLDKTENNFIIYNGSEKYYELWGILASRWYNPWARLYRSEIFINLRYIPNASWEDANIVHKILARAKRVVYTKKELYFYLQRKDSIMNSQYNPKRLDLLDGEYDRIIFFRDILKDSKLANAADTNFFIYLIKNFYLVDKYVNDAKYYKNKIKKRYRNIVNALEQATKLEGNNIEYNEDFSKFVKLNIPLREIWKKMETINAFSDIAIIGDKECCLRISYDVRKDNSIKIFRMFFLDDITNWSNKNGLEITMWADNVQSQVVLGVVDANDIDWWIKLELPTSKKNIQIAFKNLNAPYGRKLVAIKDLDLKRVKYLAFVIIGKLEHEASNIYIKDIKLY